MTNDERWWVGEFEEKFGKVIWSSYGKPGGINSSERIKLFISRVEDEGFNRGLERARKEYEYSNEMAATLGLATKRLKGAEDAKS